MNKVTIMINATDQDGGNITNGHLHFQVNDLALNLTTNTLIVINPVDVYADTGSFAQSATIELLAMDNDEITANWSWMVSGEVNGATMPQRHITVNFANGDTQNLATLIAQGTLVGS